MSNDNKNDSAEHDIAEDTECPIGAVIEAGQLGKWIDKGGIIFAMGIILSMLILIQEVFLRYVFNSPTIWAHEATIFLCAMAFIYGGLYCAARNTHIRVVIIYDYVPASVRRILDVIISIVSAVAAGFFAWAAWVMVQRAAFEPGGKVRFETSGSAWDPPTPALLKISMLVILVVMSIQFLILAINYARGLSLNKNQQSSKQGDAL